MPHRALYAPSDASVATGTVQFREGYRSLRARRSLALLTLVAGVAACGGASGVGPDDDDDGGNGGNGGTPGAVPVIVFDMVVDGNRDIYSVKADGSDLTRLTTSPGDDRHPTAAGTRVVFTSNRNSGAAELYTVSLATKNEARLTESPNRQELDPAISPDGKRLAFSAAGGAPAFGYEGAVESSASWSPDGTRLVFASTQSGTADIYILDLGQSGAPKVTPFQGTTTTEADFEPAWSPDGKSIAFTSNRAGGDAEIYVAAVAGGEPVRLTTRAGTDASPTWLSDGRIAYVAWDGDSSRLRIVDPKNPAQPVDVNIGAGSPQRPAGVR